MSKISSGNHLKYENSIYLKQHQTNPVNWWPFSPDAILKAKENNKPIFLSIGHASSHWCQIMAKESFSNSEIAKILNENFICIKVDRDEYPDIDNYYQMACQLFTRKGGWPLSAFLLPDMKPFYVGTYFPATPSNECISFKEIISELANTYKSNHQQAIKNAAEATNAIEEGLTPKGIVQYEGHFPHPMSILKAVSSFKDKEFGGYGQEPKFPNFSFYEWAIEQMLEGKIEKEEGEHIVNTIEKILMGGIFDQVRGGIHSYSTDKKWLVPHFEKILYDQAGLLSVLAKVSLIWPSPLVFDAIIMTLDYLENEMLSEQKYFFSSQGSDSEGVEGLYYTFLKEEFEDALNQVDGKDKILSKKIENIEKWFAITQEGNFARPSKLNILSLNDNCKGEFFTPENWDIIRKVRQALHNSRKKRIPPLTDSKGVASWNFMLLSALADTFQYCKIDIIKRQAMQLIESTVESILETFVLSHKVDQVKIRHTTTLELSFPYLEDHISLADCLLRIYEVTGNSRYKDMFYDSLKSIHHDFIKDNNVYTRSFSTSDHTLYPNIKVSPFDHTIRSPLSTLIALTRRGALLFMDPELLSPINKILENHPHQALKSPLDAGEALRALTYPDEAYRVMQVPQSWINKDHFINFLPYFLPRFVIDYHTEENEKWHISSLTQCELEGEQLDNFIKELTPPSEESDT